jgi:hypothetical protein
MSNEAGTPKNGADAPPPENLRTVYGELCTSYRAIDDFRTKLLGFLPLATGSGLFLLATDPQKLAVIRPYFESIGLFGFSITLGLFCYEFYGIKKCGALIRAGRALEKQLHIGDGQFLQRPHEVLGLINEPFAAGVIYPAVLAAWTFVASHSRYPNAARGLAAVVFFVGFAISLFSILKGKHKTRSILDANDREAINARLRSLSVASTRRWGSMDLAGMLEHLRLISQHGAGRVAGGVQSKRAFQVFPLKHLILYVFRFPKERRRRPS